MCVYIYVLERKSRTSVCKRLQTRGILDSGFKIQAPLVCKRLQTRVLQVLLSTKYILAAKGMLAGI